MVDEGLGIAHAALAASRLPAAERASHWRAASASFKASLAFWVEMRDTGRATSADELGAPDRLAREIARCDEALASAR